MTENTVRPIPSVTIKRYNTSTWETHYQNFFSLLPNVKNWTANQCASELETLFLKFFPLQIGLPVKWSPECFGIRVVQNFSEDQWLISGKLTWGANRLMHPANGCMMRGWYNTLEEMGLCPPFRTVTGRRSGLWLTGTGIQ